MTSPGTTSGGPLQLTTTQRESKSGFQNPPMGRPGSSISPPASSASPPSSVVFGSSVSGSVNVSVSSSSLLLSSLLLCSVVVAEPASGGVAVPPHAASTSTSTPALTAEYAVRTMPASSRWPHRCSTYPNVLPVTGDVNGPRIPRPTVAVSRTPAEGLPQPSASSCVASRAISHSSLVGTTNAATRLSAVLIRVSPWGDALACASSSTPRREARS